MIEEEPPLKAVTIVATLCALLFVAACATEDCQKKHASCTEGCSDAVACTKACDDHLGDCLMSATGR